METGEYILAVIAFGWFVLIVTAILALGGPWVRREKEKYRVESRPRSGGRWHRIDGHRGETHARLMCELLAQGNVARSYRVVDVGRKAELLVLNVDHPTRRTSHARLVP